MPPTHAGLKGPRAYVRLAEIVRPPDHRRDARTRSASAIDHPPQPGARARAADLRQALRMLEGEGPVRATVSCARELSRELGWLEPIQPGSWGEGGLVTAAISCADKTFSDWPFPPDAQCGPLTAQQFCHHEVASPLRNHLAPCRALLTNDSVGP